jgi:iron complex outermembrane receptor protein
MQTGILRSAHVGNLTDLQLAIESDTPLNDRNLFTRVIDRPYQQAGHLTSRNKAVLRINDTWKLTGQYVFQYNQRREYDVVRSSGSARYAATTLFQLWTNTLDATIEHQPVRALAGRSRYSGRAANQLCGQGRTDS